MDGTGDYYAKWNKLDGETHTIWSHLQLESNEQNKLTSKQNPRQKHRTDWELSEGRGEAETAWKKVKGLNKNMYAWPTDMINRVGIDCGMWELAGERGVLEKLGQL